MVFCVPLCFIYISIMMKKIILLSLFVVLFLAGCKNKTDFLAIQVEPATEITKWSGRILPPDT